MEKGKGLNMATGPQLVQPSLQKREKSADERLADSFYLAPSLADFAKYATFGPDGVRIRPKLVSEEPD